VKRFNKRCAILAVLLCIVVGIAQADTVYRVQGAHEDLRWYVGDEDDTTFTRRDPSGRLQTVHRVGGLTANGAVYDGISEAVSAVGSTVCTLHVPKGSWPVVSNTTIPTTLSLHIERGGVLAVSSGVTLTINGTVNYSSNQIFSGAGTITFGPGTLYARPEWWGENTTPGTTDMTAEIQAAIDATIDVVMLDSVQYLVSSTLLVRTTDDNLIIRGSGNTTDIYYPSGADEILNVQADYVRLLDFKITGNGSSSHGLYITDSKNFICDRLTINTLGGNGIHIDPINSSTYHARIMNCDIFPDNATGDGVGISSPGTGNANGTTIFQGRIRGCKYGINVDDDAAGTIRGIGVSIADTVTAGIRDDGDSDQWTNMRVEGNGDGEVGLLLDTNCTRVQVWGGTFTQALTDNSSSFTHTINSRFAGTRVFEISAIAEFNNANGGMTITQQSSSDQRHEFKDIDSGEIGYMTEAMLLLFPGIACEYYDEGNESGAITLDAENGCHQEITLTGDMTALSIDNTYDGMFFVLEITQDATGSRLVDFSGGTPAFWVAGSAFTASTGANDVDMIIFNRKDGAMMEVGRAMNLGVDS